MWTPFVVRTRGVDHDASIRAATRSNHGPLAFTTMRPRSSRSAPASSSGLTGALAPGLAKRHDAGAGRRPVLVNRADDFRVVLDQRAVLGRVDGVLDGQPLR